ncbi:MAG: polymerase sigma-C factor [Frankiales bacterium]|nr:polymerase sigma-C factor [Frankiales bacterium]
MDELAGWAQAARDGDPVAVAALVRATQQEVRRLCAWLVDPASADDLAQDTYVRALGALPGYEARSPFRPWLLSIARRTCADELRRRARRRNLVSRLRGGLQDRWPDRTEAVALEDLLARLDRDRREAFVLTQVLGLSYGEAAQVCDVPVGTIRSRVARARSELLDEVVRQQA